MQAVSNHTEEQLAWLVAAGWQWRPGVTGYSRYSRYSRDDLLRMLRSRDPAERDEVAYLGLARRIGSGADRVALPGMTVRGGVLTGYQHG